ncbi:MAG: gamma-carotene 1'-hydroxylase CruF [Cyanobacteria bacterium J06638_22]
MGKWQSVERFCLYGHLVSMAFGLAGLLLVMPHPEFLQFVPFGPKLYTWSMAGGGVIYILLGAIAVSLYAVRTLGLRGWLGFLIPSVGLSLASELSGTSTGFPFGDYSYLSGLGYKIAGLVPFTIPLSWYYLGLSAYLLARAGLGADTEAHGQRFLRTLGAIALGSILLTSWDFVLDPAMSQTALPFWYWHQPGAFFGMPYQNFAGWFGTGVVFMTVASVLWGKTVTAVRQADLHFPLVIYLGNIVFATVMSLAAGFWVPVLLGMLTGTIPAILFWKAGQMPVLRLTVPPVAQTAEAQKAKLSPSVQVGTK